MSLKVCSGSGKLISISFLRKFLFYVFALIYMVLCPVLVLYSIGYILRPGTIDQLAKTGSIHLSSVPSGATVYLKNRRYNEKTPTTVQGLLPGDYDVKVSLKGYQSWRRVVSVRAEEAAAFDSIALIKNNSGNIASDAEAKFIPKDEQT